MLFIVFQRFRKKIDSEGNTIKESSIFNYVDIVTHNDGREMCTFAHLMKGPLDDCDTAINNHMSLEWRNIEERGGLLLLLRNGNKSAQTNGHFFPFL